MQLQNVILVMGPPGSGKGTQSKLLMQKLGYAYFSMGETLREYAKMDTDFGREIKTTIDQGFIVKDEAAKRVFEESFEKIKDIPGLIIEGYPRTKSPISNSILCLSISIWFQSTIIVTSNYLTYF